MMIEPAPRTYERLVATLLEAEGYTTQLGSYIGDGGIDIIASRGDERLAVQAKMYGSGRPVNRHMILELHGAAACSDCTGAVIATDGRLMADASEAARKLGIRVMLTGELASIPSAEPAPQAHDKPRPALSATAGDLDFDSIWSRSVIPLAGKTLTRPDGSANRIVAVDWSGVTRITSNGRPGFIPIEVFRWALARVLTEGSVTRGAINEQYAGRASSGVVLILAHVPEFTVGGRPLTVRLAGAEME